MIATKNMLIIVFDVDGTIMSTKSGNKFQKDEDDYKVIWRPVIPEGASVYLHTNQKGRLADICKKKIRAAKKIVGAKAALIGKIADERKPNAGVLLEMINADKTEDIILVVGDAAGRDDDHSDTDLKLALNLSRMGYNAHFVAPEDYEDIDMNDVPTSAKRIFAASSYTVTYPNLAVPQKRWFSIDKIPSTATVALTCGLQGSGKSTIVDEMKDNGWKAVTYTSAAATLKKALQVKGKVVIDGTFPKEEMRKKFISSFPDRDAVIIRVTTPSDLAKHNRIYREINHGASVIPAIAVSTFEKNFDEPTEEEGAKIIRCRPYVPEDDDVLYHLYYY